MGENIQTGKMDKKVLLSWIVTIGLPAMILFIPTTEVITFQLKLFLAITLMGILMFAFENLNQTAVAILLPMAYILTGLAPSQVVMAPWTTDIPWMMLGGLILAGVLNRIGLLKRIAYKCIVLTGGSYSGILYGLTVAGIILNVAIPGQAVIPMAALSFGICSALNLGKSREAAGIMLTAAMASLLPMMFLFNPNVMIIFNTAAEVTGPIAPTWVGFIAKNAVSVLFVFFMTFIASVMFKPQRKIEGKEYFVKELAGLGKLKIEEKKALFVCGVLFLYLVTGQWHKLNLGFGFAAIPMLLFVPGINVATQDDVKNVNYPFLLFVTACMGIGTVAGSLGLGQIVSNAVMPMLQGQSPTIVLLFVWVLCVLLNFLLTPLAIMSAFSIPFAQIALDLGINPGAMFFTMYHGLDQILMPYEYALYLIFFSFGLIYLKDFVKLMGTKILVNGLFVFFVLIPFWKLIGYL